MGWGNKFPDLKNDPSYLEPRLTAAETSLAEIAINVKSLGAKGDGVTDDTIAIQNALNQAHTVSGASVLIPPGNYLITSTLVIYDYTTLIGVGSASTILSNTDIEMLNTPSNGATNVAIRNLRFLNNVSSPKTKYDIKLPNTTFLFMQYVEVNIANATANLTDVGGIQLPGGGSVTFMAHIDKCWIRNGSIDIQITDSKVTNTWVWAQNKDFGIHTSASNATIENCDIVPSPSHGGVYVTNAVWGTKISNCMFDGSYNNVDTGFGIYQVQGYGTVINGNYFWHSSQGGVYCQDCLDNSIMNNFFYANNKGTASAQQATSSDVVIASNAFVSSGNIVSGNTFRQEQANPAHAIEERDMSTSHTTGNILANNTIDGYYHYASPSVKINRSTSTSSLRNCGAGIGAAGTATIASGTNSITVNYGGTTEYIPIVTDIRLQPTAGLNGGGAFWITNITASGFTINTSNNVTTNTSFSYFLDMP